MAGLAPCATKKRKKMEKERQLPHKEISGKVKKKKKKKEGREDRPQPTARRLINKSRFFSIYGQSRGPSRKGKGEKKEGRNNKKRRKKRSIPLQASGGEKESRPLGSLIF